MTPCGQDEKGTAAIRLRWLNAKRCVFSFEATS